MHAPNHMKNLRDNSVAERWHNLSMFYIIKICSNSCYFGDILGFTFVACCLHHTVTWFPTDVITAKYSHHCCLRESSTSITCRGLYNKEAPYHGVSFFSQLLHTNSACINYFPQVLMAKVSWHPWLRIFYKHYLSSGKVSANAALTTKFVLHFCTCPTLGIKPETFWSWAHSPVDLAMCSQVYCTTHCKYASKEVLQ